MVQVVASGQCFHDKQVQISHQDPLVKRLALKKAIQYKQGNQHLSHPVSMYQKHEGILKRAREMF